MWKDKDSEKNVSSGEVIVREGDQGFEMYIIRKGAVEVIKNVNGKEIILDVLERGEFFGEMSLLEGLPRSATIRAKSDVTLLVLTSGNFMLKIKRDPSFAFEVLQKMSARIRRMNEEIRRFAEMNQVLKDDLDRIIIQPEYKENQWKPE